MLKVTLLFVEFFLLGRALCFCGLGSTIKDLLKLRFVG
jgi:hypothetical protein